MDDEAVVDWKGLKGEYGWPYSRTQTWRLMLSGHFPRSFKLVDARNAHPVWRRNELTDFFKSRQALEHQAR